MGIMNLLADEGAAHGILLNAVSPVAKSRMWGVEGEPDELKPETGAPGVAVLASAATYRRRLDTACRAGQFHATRAVEAKGADYPRDLRKVHVETPAAVAAAQDEIAVLAQEPRS